MSEKSVADVAATEPEWLAPRLDALDQALIGLLPRHERLAVVSDVESRLRRSPRMEPLVASAPVLPAPFAPHTTSESSNGPAITVIPAVGTPKKRSRIAYASGLNGIAALALTVSAPCLFFLALVFANVIGQFGLIAVMGILLALIVITTVVAMSGGLLSIFRTGSTSDRTGRGWALTGVFAAATPILLLLVSFQSIRLDNINKLVTLIGYMSASDPALDRPDLFAYTDSDVGANQVESAYGTARQVPPIRYQQMYEDVAEDLTRSDSFNPDKVDTESLRPVRHVSYDEQLPTATARPSNPVYEDEEHLEELSSPRTVILPAGRIPSEPFDAQADSVENRPIEPAEPTLIPVDPESETTD